MQVQSVNYSNSFRANDRKLIQKVIKGQLKDDSTALVRLTFNNRNDVVAIEGYNFKHGELIGGRAIGQNNGLHEKRVLGFLARIQKDAKEGFNLFKEYTLATMSKI